MKKRIAIIGGGPAGLLVYKRLVDLQNQDLNITIFEKSNQLGSGMPYSTRGAINEHITNVSGDEIPQLMQSLTDWIKSLPNEKLNEYGIDREHFHKKKVLPRLLFGEYLADQFQFFINRANQKNIQTEVLLETEVQDIHFASDNEQVLVQTTKGEEYKFDQIVICTGHHWPTSYEGKIEGYFNSPYPPAKLLNRLNHTIAIRGSSLTAVDAVRSLARANGSFHESKNGLSFIVNPHSPNFKIEMHSLHGLLPSLRVHMENPQIAKSAAISKDQITANKKANAGFVQLDFIFDEAFKKPLKLNDPTLYERIKDMNLEKFVDMMMTYRENQDAFVLLKKEFAQSLSSIESERPVPWKELLADLSFEMNYPAKHLSAEDMLRLQKTLMPLISVVIAFLPQSSCEELIALHEAGRLDLICDGKSGKIEITDDKKIKYSYDSDGTQITNYYQTFVDCIGQPHLSLESFPFKSLIETKELSPARLKFRDSENGKILLEEKNKNVEKLQEEYFLRVPGVAITDDFNIVNTNGKANPRIYLMAVPFIGGFNPDYSGLDFCEHASQLIVDSITKFRP